MDCVVVLLQLNSETPNEADDASANATDDSVQDNNFSEDNSSPIKEENDFEIDSEQDDPTGNIDELCISNICYYSHGYAIMNLFFFNIF